MREEGGVMERLKEGEKEIRKRQRVRDEKERGKMRERKKEKIDIN